MPYSVGTVRGKISTPKREVLPDGTVEWRSYGQLHRDGGPAKVYPCGYMEWWVDGKLHRDGGPAVDYGWNKEWHYHGKKHRIDGPVVEWQTRPPEWFIHGRQLTEDEFDRYVDQTTGEVFIPPGKKLFYDYK